MKQVLKKAKVKYDPSIISAATDEKTFSGKRIENFLFGLFFFGLGLFTLYYSVDFLIGIPGDWNGIILVYIGIGSNKAGWFGNLIILFIAFAMLIAAVLFLIFGVYLIRGKSEWFFVLYPDSVLYKYKGDSKNYKTVTFPISEIKKCCITRKRKNTRVPVYKKNRTRVFIEITYRVNVHLMYEKESESHYISMTNTDGLDALNKSVAYLQNEKKIPIYFTVVEPEQFEDIDEVEFLKSQELEQVEFTGDLKVYDMPNRQVDSL